jgi:hypothetical protein
VLRSVVEAGKEFYTEYKRTSSRKDDEENSDDNLNTTQEEQQLQEPGNKKRGKANKSTATNKEKLLTDGDQMSPKVPEADTVQSGTSKAKL